MKALTVHDVKEFTPFQHFLNYAEPLTKIKGPFNPIFNIQSENMRLILAKNLTNDEIKSFIELPYLPEGIQNQTFNVIAQKELEKAVHTLRGQKFSRDLDSVFLPEP